MKSPAARLECGVVLLSLFALFVLPFSTWWQHWRQPESIQAYAAWIPFLLLGWLWLNRYRIVLPELDELNERFTERSVLRFLLEEEPEPARRLRWPLVFACLVTPFALRLGDPTLTCMAFVLLTLGIVGYRFGTHLLRVVFFPICLLFAMIPLPAFFVDSLGRRFDALAFKVTVHLLQIFGFNAELPGVESNPLTLYGAPGQPAYHVFQGQIGTGWAEAGVFIVLTLCYLSLVNAMFRQKVAALVIGAAWIILLLIGRIFLLASLGRVIDEDYFAALIPLTRYLLPVLGMMGQLLIMRGLKCRQFHEWVSV